MSHAPSIAGLAGRAVWATWSTSWQAAHPWRTGLTLLLPAVPMLGVPPWPLAMAANGEGTPQSPPLAIALLLRHLGPGGYRADTAEPSPLRATRTAASHVRCEWPPSARGSRRRWYLPPCCGLGSLLLAPLLPPGVLTASLVTAIALWQRRWIPGLGVADDARTAFVVIWLYDRLPASRASTASCVAVVLCWWPPPHGASPRLQGAAMLRTVRATKSCRRFALASN